MKRVSGSVLVGLLFTLTACGRPMSDVSTTTTPAQVQEKVLTLNDVNDGFKAQGLELKDSGSISNIELLGTKATVYLFDNGFLSVYVFKSASDREKAQQDFLKQIAHYHVVNPETRLYSADNVLLYYGKNDYQLQPLPRDQSIENALKTVQ